MSKGEGRARPDRVRTRTRNEKKFQKPLDKATKVWYNNNVEGRGTPTKELRSAD